MAAKINQFHKLLQTEVPSNITSEAKETFHSVNKALSDACELSLEQPIPGMQLLFLRDASFGSAGHVLMIEDNPDQKLQSKQKTYAPWRLAQRFSPARNSKSPYTQMSFWHFIWHISSWHTFCEKQQN